MLHDRRTSSLNRHAFTLIELLVVIAIIAVLASLAAWGTFAMIGNRQARNTEATIRVVNKLLQDRWGAVIADAKKEAPSAAVLALASNDAARARVLWIKVRLLEAFPVTYSEVLTPTVLNSYILPDRKFKPHFARYQSHLAGKTGGGAGESSACLLMALKTLQGGGTNIEDQLTYAVSDTDGDGVKELIDGWSRPLAFFRFPTGPIVDALNPATAGSRSAKFADLTDVDGTLINATWYWSGNRSTFENLATSPGFPAFHPVAPAPVPNSAPTPPARAYFVLPVIVSAGKDGILAINASLGSTGPGSVDNIYSFNLKGD